MKYMPGFTDFFMSPVTGRIILPMMPDLPKNYVWLGDRGDRPLPSPVIIDLRLEIIDIRNRLSRTRFILQAPSPHFDSSQALNELVPGILKHNEGIVSIAFPWIDYVPPILPEKNIWIGNADDVPEPYPRIFLENLPSMLSDNPDLLDGAYNLYRGSPDPLTLGIPEIVKTLHITNMADLTQGHLWLGTDSSDPLNFGLNRPVEIIVLPLANMADLPEGQIWVGNGGNRPEPSDVLSGIEIDIDSIFDHLVDIDIHLGDIDIQIGDINISIGDINIQLGDINTSIETILETISDITVDFGDIIIRLDGLDGIVADLQTQIDTNVASGLDHLADLQLQIDTNVASGLDALATINLRLDALELSVTTINSTITTIQSAITTINTTITSIQSDITTLFSDITSINASITSILSSISTINTTITTIQSNITTINTTLTSLQTQINTINTTLTTISGQITTINTTITTIQGDITTINGQITAINTAITNITNSFVAGGVVNMNNNRIINLPCDPVEDNDAISFCFLWHIFHDEVTVSWS